jgi:hypothetical protein
LLAKGGFYKELYEKQTQTEETEVADDLESR